MGMKWWIRIHTATTTNKQLAIRKAQKGQLDTESLNYMQERYEKALFWQLREILHQEKVLVPDVDIRDFCMECVNDAFVDIKKYNTHKKFRTFLVNKIIKPKLGSLVYHHKKRKDAEKKYVEERLNRKITKKLSGFHKHLMAQFIDDAVKRFKTEDPKLHDIFFYRYYDEMPYADIIKRVSQEFPEVSNEAYARKLFERAKKEIKHIVREIYKGDSDLARKLPFSKGLKDALGKETTKK